MEFICYVDIFERWQIDWHVLQLWVRTVASLRNVAKSARRAVPSSRQVPLSLTPILNCYCSVIGWLSLITAYASFSEAFYWLAVFVIWLLICQCHSYTFNQMYITGKLCIEVTVGSKLAFISEELCIGCGIWVKVSLHTK